MDSGPSGFHNSGIPPIYKALNMNRISINLYPFDTRDNWNIRCLIAYALASLVGLLLSVRYRVPTFNQKTAGDGPPDSVMVRHRPSLSLTAVSFSHAPIGTPGCEEEGEVRGAMLGYEWEVFYAHRNGTRVTD